MKASLRLKLVVALKQDKGIMTTRDLIQHRSGENEKYLTELGLTNRDLRLLERTQVAIRGRKPTQNGHIRVWLLVGRSEDYL